MLIARRRALTPEVVRLKGDEASARLVALPFFAAGACTLVALYRGRAEELSVDRAWVELRQRGIATCFPRVVKGNRVLELARCDTPDDFQPAAFGLLEPKPSCRAVSPADVDVWVIPAVGLSLDGSRIGHGAGYYDSTLAHARTEALRVGATLDACLVDVIPREPHDMLMDWVCTETQSVKVQSPER